MIHNVDYIAGYYKWREDMLKPCCRANWKCKSHIRYLSISKASTLCLLKKLRGQDNGLWGRYN